VAWVQGVSYPMTELAFHKDPEVVRQFWWFRTVLAITFFGVFALWMSFFGWVYFRLHINGYTYSEAQANRMELCNSLELWAKDAHGDLKCPHLIPRSLNGRSLD